MSEAPKQPRMPGRELLEEMRNAQPASEQIAGNRPSPKFDEGPEPGEIHPWGYQQTILSLRCRLGAVEGLLLAAERRAEKWKAVCMLLLALAAILLFSVIELNGCVHHNLNPDSSNELPD